MDPKKLQGFETPDDKKVTVTQREWNAVKLALWRNKEAWETVTREAQAILESCMHLEGCPAATDETAACPGAGAMARAFKQLGTEVSEGSESSLTFVPETPESCCPDREKRISALVILNSARQFAPINARKLADGPYFAPSREYFSEVIAGFAAAQAELQELRTPVVVTTQQTVTPKELP